MESVGVNYKFQHPPAPAAKAVFFDSLEPLAELNKTVTPVTSGVQKTLKNLDSGFRRNDVEGLLQKAPLIRNSSLFHHLVKQPHFPWYCRLQLLTPFPIRP
jgi:hypothetical protein